MGPNQAPSGLVLTNGGGAHLHPSPTPRLWGYDVVPRVQPVTQEIQAFTATLRPLSTLAETVSGTPDEVALITAVSEARNAVLNEVAALRQAWGGTTIDPGSTPEALSHGREATLQAALISSDPGPLIRTLVAVEIALAKELQALREAFPMGGSILSGIGSDNQVAVWSGADTLEGVASLNRATGEMTLTDIVGGAKSIVLTPSQTKITSILGDLTLAAGTALDLILDVAGGGDVKLPDYLSGILGTDGSGILGVNTGATDGITVWSTAAALTNRGSLTSAEILTLTNTNTLTFNPLQGEVTATGSHLNLGSSAGFDVVLVPGGGGNVVFNDLFSGILQVDVLGVTTADAAHGDLDDMPDTGGGSNTDHDARYLLRSLVNGTFQESFDAVVTESGGVVKVSLEQSGGGDLTMQFSDGITTLDCTPAKTQTLTPGDDDDPRENFVFIPVSTKNIVADTNWPSEEHIKIGYFLLPSAFFISGDGVYVNQNWNDHLTGTDDQGHLTHMAERSRRLGAIYFSGIDPDGTDQDTNSSYFDYVSGTEAYIKTASGVIYQMHRHSVSAQDSRTADILVVNHDTTPYMVVNDLTDITADANGGALANKFFNLTLWAVANKTGEYTPLMLNLPLGSYNTAAAAAADTDGHDVLTMPREFNIESSTGFLIARLTCRITGTNWSHIATVDLRGQTPATAIGGASGTTTAFADNQFSVFDEGDPTKVLNFDVGTNVTTATTRTLKVPDADGTIPLTDLTASADDLAVWASTSGLIGRASLTSAEILTLTNTNTLVFNPLQGEITSGGSNLNLGAGTTFDVVINPGPSSGDFVLNNFSDGPLQVSGGSGVVSAITGGARADVLIRGASAWENLTPPGGGTGENYLQYDGSLDMVFGSLSGSHIQSGMVAPIFGGLGLNNTTVGDVIYASAAAPTPAYTYLLANTSSTNKFLRSVNGPAAPSYEVLADTDVPVSARTYAEPLYVEDPTATDVFMVAYIPMDITLKRVVAVTDTGTVDFNIEVRGKLTPDTAGTNIWTSDETAIAAGLDETSFDIDQDTGSSTPGTIDGDQWLTFAASAVASSPTELWLTIVYEIRTQE